MAAAYRLQAGDLTGWWRWVNPAHQARGVRPDGEVFLDGVAQVQLAGWCRVPAGHLARALPSWGAGSEMLAGYGGDGQGWVRWRTGADQWGPVVFGCRLCTARRGGAGVSWVYRARWQRLCTDHGRWLLDVGGGHVLEGLAVGPLAGELGRAQRRWACLARAGLDAGGAGGAPVEVFALARAVVCGWVGAGGVRGAGAGVGAAAGAGRGGHLTA
ncbi:hypothetical protein KBZ94_41715 [Streptomyces sp. RM72]|uniref:hypothetical protein n=1 Tax=Streptomyces sp. RM72 TaxID=1115510 RepID=UPI001B387FC6|nr:hypothetical protein [Streptomyces sp. RM72]MBQ0891351.1 hypothetical protein [Streptomyces sp. RM72]